MASNHSQGYTQPIMELLYSAEVFGCDFEKVGRLTHLKHTARNASQLHRGAAKCIILLEQSSGRPRDPRVTEAISWLSTLHRDFGEIVRSIQRAIVRRRRRLKTKAAS